MALVAYVSREDRRIELDLAVRAGARLDGRGEAVLLHTTNLGHCQETADYLARVLRMSGWEVAVRKVETALLGEIRTTAPGMVTPEQTAALVEAVTHEHVPKPARLTPRSRSLPERWVCTACGHSTLGAGLASHKANRQHFDFVRVPVDQIAAVQAQIAHARAQACPPEALEAPLDPSDQRPNGVSPPERQRRVQMSAAHSEWDREEHERQRAAALALRARIEGDAARQRETRQIVRAEQQFAEHAEHLARIDRDLQAGQPLDTLPSQDLKFVLGRAETKRVWDSVGGSRRSRWRTAIEAMPDPPPDATDHVRTTYATHLDRAYARKKDSLLRRVPKQTGWWYRELARLEVGRTLANHVCACALNCAVEEWSFVLDLPSFMPKGETFDPAGNFKPTNAQHEPDEDAAGTD